MINPFDESTLASVATLLAATDQLLEKSYPGDSGARQPIHTVYVPGDQYSPELPAAWGHNAMVAAGGLVGLSMLATKLNLAEPQRLAELVAEKLASEPIEDLRIDFEDGFGNRSDAEEDAAVLAAADSLAAAIAANKAPSFIGIRFKCFEAPTRARGIRTLGLFIAQLLSRGQLPAGLRLTLPKVTTVDQVKAMVLLTEKLEETHGLEPGTLRFEVQVETPQVIIAADGTHPVAGLIHAGQGRVSSLHYGTYDYSASLGVAAGYQSMEHPVADYAKDVMQVAVAGTGVELSDGSTNIIPAGDPENMAEAWALHARLVSRHLARGIYQGWDLHENQLPTRYLATFAFFREGLQAAGTRLRNYVHQISSTIMDEPATARALARYIHRGVTCGAVSAEEVAELAQITLPELEAIALNRSHA
ncbi:aldolase/citrate lyase family protein [Glutamicibacter ectropisis]|uniref:Aldolase/citrate lyase family protein n=1 Tax=Glutamicibacter ectropisis TaxID=3046593 RepID=A0AAU6WDL9_9MICC